MSNIHSVQHSLGRSGGQPDCLLTPKTTAELLGVSLSWLAKARLRGDGPRFVKIGRAVRYSETYVREYIKVQTRSSTSET